MVRETTQKVCRVLCGAASIVFVAVAVAADVPALPDESAVVWVASEQSVNGITVDEFYERQAQLHARLTAEMPDGKCFSQIPPVLLITRIIIPDVICHHLNNLAVT